MNTHSSRSHLIVTVYTTTKPRANDNAKAVEGKMNLIDLAGSERVNRSGASGAMLKEATAINKSLSSLGDVIHARVAKHGHVPYRNCTSPSFSKTAWKKSPKYACYCRSALQATRTRNRCVR